MQEFLIMLATNFILGASHAIQPGHGKTIAAAYIVGARGRPVDAWILGIFVTLSHTSGIVLVGIGVQALPASMANTNMVAAWLAIATGILVIVLGFWALWTQRQMFALAGWTPGQPRGGQPVATTYRIHEPARGHSELQAAGHPHSHAAGHTHSHSDGHVHSHDGEHDGHAHSHTDASGYHSHGWGVTHTHDVVLATTARPSFWILIWLGIAGGILPDPIALTLLMSYVVKGQVIAGLAGVLSFSLGFALVLVAVGVVAAVVGRRIMDWLVGVWAARFQLATSFVIVVVGFILTYFAWRQLSQLA